ncbi:MAG: acyltransferase domain-containing protein [Saprospiraceae bacterium]|nr:acyltransferase domain-containing protein [Saprospiraceae bacterium]
MTDITPLLRQHPVAIVGMASIFADSENLEQYWENIVQGIDCIREVPDNRWTADDYFDADPFAPDKTYCKVGGFLPEIDFNPMEFGLPPNLLESTDASQLLGMAIARDALIDAGYAPGSERLHTALRERTGVILGVGGGQKMITPLIARLQYPVWRKALETHGIPEDQIETIIEQIKAAYIPWTENTFPGLLGNVIAGRIANRFDLGGLNSVVDAACAASLSATKMAISELIEGSCDMVITGGVDTDNSPFMYMSFSKTPAFSRKGSIRPFDHESDGMLIGEGVGMIVCKRLADAQRDGDRIYAVIKGIGGSSDGRYKSIYAPRPHGQALAMQRAYDDAGFDPSTVGLIEAHGTGTGAGDPSEAESMKGVFGKNNPRLHHIALGSVKSQIGHTKASAGIAGLIKTALALHHKILPGTINVTLPNAALHLEDSPLYVNSETRPWFRKSAQTPRRAGVSAFGFGGVNLHVAMEELQEEQNTPYRQYTVHSTVLLYGATSETLAQQCREHLAHLLEPSAKNHLRKMAWQSAKSHIPPMHARLGFVASSVEEAQQKLETCIKLLAEKAGQPEWEHPIAGIWFRQSAMNQDQKVVALFAGQGSQYVNMGRELSCAYPAIRESFRQVNQIFETRGQHPLTDVIYPIPVFNDADRKAQQLELTRTQYAQPAIGALSAGMYRLLAEAGFAAEFYAGHSYGELTALWAAGVLDDATFYALSKARGEAMAIQGEGDTGAMLAVKTDFETLRSKVAAYPDIQVANINSGTQVILGGATESLVHLQAQLQADGFIASLLPVSAAFHTPFVAHAHQPFAAAIQSANFSATSKMVFSNTTGIAYPAGIGEMKATLTDHMLKPVLFKEKIENIYAAGGRVFVEFGPRNILSNLVREILAGKPHTAISLNPNPQKDGDKQLREAVVQLTVLGIQIQDFDRFALPPTEKPVAKGLNVRISGNNYVSDATVQKYEQALKLNSEQAQIRKSSSINISTPVAPQPVKELIEQPMSQQELEILQNIQAELARLNNQQSQMVAILDRLSRTSAPAPQQLAAPAPPPMPLPVSNGNGNYTNGVSAKTVAVQAPPAPAPATAGISTAKIEKTLLSVIAEKTGYPAEMLELGMDMEADLGIDSIKRVEIFGAMTSAHPEIQGINPQELAELRTLQQIVQYIAGKAGATATPAPQPAAPAVQAPAPAPVVAAAPAPAPLAAPAGMDSSKIEKTLLAVIAEKTGYPAEMLELGMDMEADLGIDSIKRVEIFGAMTAAHPEIQGINPQELAELRTLNQIVQYIAGKAGVSSAPVAAPAPAPAPVAIVQPAPPAPAPVAAPAGMDSSKIEKTLLAVIAEKTGYPAEMLELGMDMEADLGIDSIKRVEIFGAMTAAHPEIQGINPQELAELRTLNQIVQYIAGKAGVSAAPAPVAAAPAPVAAPTAAPTAPAATGISSAMIEKTLLTVIAEKTGYPAEMLELGMDMEADLGIDSIKRVEIFGAMTAAHPEIQGINPQELAELRTLNQIVQYILGKAGTASEVAGGKK